MNHIKSLQAENNELHAKVQSYEEALNCIIVYARSEKFREPLSTMNPNDVVLRAQEALDFVNNLELPQAEKCQSKECNMETWHISKFCNLCRK